MRICYISTMRILIALLCVITLTACQRESASTVEIVERDYLTQLLVDPSKEQIQVINFWATWCVPCVEELPVFVDLDKRDGIDVILISLDNADNSKTVVNPFLEKNEITSTVKLLDDPYAAEWIPLVDVHWDGAIPATLIQKGDKKMFYNKSFTSSELEEEVNKFL